MKNILLISTLLLFIVSCNTKRSSSAILPSPIGGADEVMIVVSDANYSKELAKDIKKHITSQYKILPQAQARFLLSVVQFSKINSLLQKFINPVFVVAKNEKSTEATLVQQMLTEEELIEAKNGKKSIFHKKNIWAKNQNITIIIAENKDDILAALKRNKKEINNFYDESNIFHYKKIAYINGVNNSLKKQLKKHHKLDFNIPLGYVIAKNEKNFILLRKDEDKSTLFLAFDVNYYNAEIPINNLGVEKFDSLGRSIDGMKENSYVVADTTLGFDISKVQEGSTTIFENGGLWVMANDLVGGGPFVNQYIIDNKNNRVIYLSGMVYGPAEKNKKKYMRQFEAIFSTLSID